MKTSYSLEDIRRRENQTIAEFAASIGITEEGYRQAVLREAALSIEDKERIAVQLQEPAMVWELLPMVSTAYVKVINAAIAEANRDGWYEVDPETDELIGKFVPEAPVPLYRIDEAKGAVEIITEQVRDEEEGGL